MGFINLFVGSNAYINIEHNQLKLSSRTDEITYPLVDLNSVLIDNLATTLSSYSLFQLSKNNVAVYFCDDKHIPSAYLLSFNSHYKVYGNYLLQAGAGRPLIKNIWRKIVMQKIINQSFVLDYFSIKNNLKELLPSVKTDDNKNLEGTAAAKYFKLLFGEDFKRGDIGNLNAALNYGYSIIRGAIARSLTAHGLQPFMGIHHAGKLNNFNLADDIIEPFRPVVDLFVKSNLDEIYQGLTTPFKMKLLSLLNYDMLIEGKTHCLSNVIEEVVNSYITCLTDNKSDIVLPQVLPPQMHVYE